MPFRLRRSLQFSRAMFSHLFVPNQARCFEAKAGQISAIYGRSQISWITLQWWFSVGERHPGSMDQVGWGGGPANQGTIDLSAETFSGFWKCCSVVMLFLLYITYCSLPCHRFEEWVQTGAFPQHIFVRRCGCVSAGSVDSFEGDHQHGVGRSCHIGLWVERRLPAQIRLCSLAAQLQFRRCWMGKEIKLLGLF